MTNPAPPRGGARASVEFVAFLQDQVAGIECPACGRVGDIVVKERYVPRPLPEILTARQTYGPHGLPLVVWCTACDSGGRVAEFTHMPGPPA